MAETRLVEKQRGSFGMSSDIGLCVCEHVGEICVCVCVCAHMCMGRLVCVNMWVCVERDSVVFGRRVVCMCV